MVKPHATPLAAERSRNTQFMEQQLSSQKAAFDFLYETDQARLEYHDTSDPLIRYLTGRRINLAMGRLRRIVNDSLSGWTALVTCGGLGGDGTLLANLGLREVTVSDISTVALRACRERDSRLKTMELDAESLDLPDNSVDLSLVQDGLHHLRRPVLGFTEMLRVSRRAVIVIEPHAGIVASVLGQVWEMNAGVENYVFRWDARLLREATRSYLMHGAQVYPMRIWDHNVTLARAGARLGGGAAATAFVNASYALLSAPGIRNLGNMMIGVVLKKS